MCQSILPSFPLPAPYPVWRLRAGPPVTEEHLAERRPRRQPSGDVQVKAGVSIERERVGGRRWGRELAGPSRPCACRRGGGKACREYGGLREGCRAAAGCSGTQSTVAPRPEQADDRTQPPSILTPLSPFVSHE